MIAKYYVYIIYSVSIDKYYIGYTNDVSVRLEKHNQHHRGFTGRANDLELKYKEGYIEKGEAIKRELEIKRWKSRKRIEHLLGLAK